jgi:hypothetical protein
MAVVQEALAEVAMLRRVEHMGSDVSVESGLACCAPHNEAGGHEPGMEMLQIVETLDDHSFACHVPIAERLVREIVDGLQICLVTHHTAQLTALLDRMPRLQRVLVYLRIENRICTSQVQAVCSGSDLEVLDQARVPSCPEVP